MTIAILLGQVFILDQLSLALWLRPMIFPIVVLLLPMEWRTVWVLLITLAVGVVMDLSLGGAGLYTASLLPFALMRATLLYIATKRSVESGDQSSLLSRLGIYQMMAYLSITLLLHHTLFFALESLSMANFLQLVGTIISSTLLSIVVAWPIVRLYNSKIVA